MTECRGYEDIMGWAIDEYKSILGGNDFRIKILEGEDNGVNFLLGLEDGVPREVIEVTKRYLGMIWREREKKILARQGLNGGE